MENNKYITIPQMAKILGLSRIAVYKKVKKGEIEAIRIGRNYAIHKKSVANILGKDLKEKDKNEIDPCQGSRIYRFQIGKGDACVR